MTYTDLAKRVTTIAQRLTEHGIGRGTVVGVFQSAKADWVLTLLAIFRVGAVYVPLDPKAGVDRLSLITRDSRPTAIVVDSQTETLDFAQTQGVAEHSVVHINVSHIQTDPKPDTFVSVRTDPADLAVIMYSSGSTGVPKGVKLTHSNLAHYGDTAPSEWHMREGQEVFLHQASLMFDASLLQTIIPLGVGSTVVVVGDEARGDPAALSELVASGNITYVGATPTEYLAWARHWDVARLRDSPWQVAFTWGEPMSKRELREFQRLDKPDLKLIDAYGPVETTISVGHGEVPLAQLSLDDDKPGNPRFPFTLIPNSAVRVVDETLNSVPAGVVGEIVIGGAGVGKGYLKDDELTKSKFVPGKNATLHFHENDWATEYRTGDRGWLTQDGRLVLQGRIEGNTQVKLAGIRIELQDIEAVITQVHQRVRQAVVSVRTKPGSATPFLVAFVVLAEVEQNSTRSESPAEQAQFLFEFPRSLPLPQYMRPTTVVAVEKLPTNSAGKLDRRAVDSLPLPDSASAEPWHLSDGSGKLTESEATLSHLWAEAIPQGLVLSTQGGVVKGSVTPQSDFFHLGGSSLALINLQALIKERLGLSVPVFQLFQASTLGTMAALLQQQQSPTFSESQDHVNDSNTPTTTPINWEDEVALPPDILETANNSASSDPNPPPPPSNPPKVIALTGSTGFIGREILRQLLDSPNTTKVHLLALRKTPSHLKSTHPTLFTHPNVTLWPGDLGAPRLGLSEAVATSLFSTVDAIIHAGADVSFLKTYRSLRLTNVASTRELVRLAAPRRVPLHFVSSAAVARLAVAARGGEEGFGAESAARWYPPAAAVHDGEGEDEDGYAVAKLVSEVLLERASVAVGVPVWIHRPSSVTGEGAGELDLMANMARYAGEIGAVPDTRGWKGRFDFVRVESVARDIVGAVLAGGEDGSGKGQLVRFRYQSSEVVVEGHDVQKSASIAGGDTPLEVLPFDAWVERAEKAGLNHLLALYLRRAAKGELLLPKLLRS